LALGLGELDFEVGFACLKPGKFAVTREAQQAPVVQLEMSSRFDLRPAWRLANLARRERYGIIHTHTPRAAMIGRLAAALARVPLVHHVHSPTTNDSTRVRQDRWNARIERLSLNGVSAVIAVSQSLAGWARDQGIPPERINVVPNGVPTRGALAERDEPGDAWTLGTVALFRPRKGLEVLLEAITMLRRGGANVRLRAVGEFETAEYQAKIHALINDLALGDAIDWIGFTQDVPRELAKMDLFVLPSLFGEGLPMVVLEAMAAGVPVVASRVEGVPEAIRDGSEGLLAHANDPTDLARAISRFVRGGVSWTQIRRDAHVRQAERFSDRSMARGVAEVYREVL
jgi:glycosyltransferase involved in cell wall biosynthesis